MSFPDDADGEALRKVATHADISKPMDLDFMVEVPSEAAGNEIARAASAREYKTSLEFDSESERWTCYCQKRMVPTYEAIIAAQKELDALSEAFGGRSDGWGTLEN